MNTNEQARLDRYLAALNGLFAQNSEKGARIVLTPDLVGWDEEDYRTYVSIWGQELADWELELAWERKQKSANS
jgi:hypothetical protein